MITHSVKVMGYAPRRCCLNDTFRETLAKFREICYDYFAKQTNGSENMQKEVNYLSVGKAAGRWGVSPRRVQQLCKEGKIDGAEKDGRSWLIPESSLPPVRLKESARSYPLPLPVGVSDYVKAVSQYYYVDKTLLIRDLIDALPMVSLFTRPRRFGKTLNMDMLRVFFEKAEEDTSVYFRDKAIWSCGEYYRGFQGRYPVIFLSFKDVKHGNWEEASGHLAALIRREYLRHPELAESHSCTIEEMQFYRNIAAGHAEGIPLSDSLFILSSMLHRHFGTETVIIIDEYDTPIQQGHMNGYYDEVVGFIRNLFSGAFKDNPHLAYGFLTGILRVAKESIFSGLNNLKVNTILDDRYSAYFGFSGEEVRKMLAYYGREDKMEEVCEWYDGYRFGNSEVFNPWSVVNYVDDQCVPKAFWVSTGSNELIGEVIASAGPEAIEKLRLLMQGEAVLSYVDTSVIYPEVGRDPSGVFSFLLVTGYLRVTEIIPQEDGNWMCRLSIPNREIRFVYAREIIARLCPPSGESTAISIRQAVFEADIPALQKYIEQYLKETVSTFDTGSESFYQGLMIGLCAILNSRYAIRSNRESGLGRFDIQLFPLNKNLPGFLLELKAGKSRESLNHLAASALEQIREKEYETEMRSAGIHEIIRLGIAFRGKEIVIKSK